MTTKRFATRNFTDAGTGRAFTAGAEMTDLSPGELLNYEHAGLAGDKPETAAAADKAPTADKAPAKAV